MMKTCRHLCACPFSSCPLCLTSSYPFSLLQMMKTCRHLCACPFSSCPPSLTLTCCDLCLFPGLCLCLFPSCRALYPFPDSLPSPSLCPCAISSLYLQKGQWMETQMNCYPVDDGLSCHCPSDCFSYSLFRLRCDHLSYQPPQAQRPSLP